MMKPHQFLLAPHLRLARPVRANHQTSPTGCSVIGEFSYTLPGADGHPEEHRGKSLEVRGRAVGRIRMRRVVGSSAESLLPFVQETVEPGAVVITDGLQIYRVLPQLGYSHDRRVLLGCIESPRSSNAG